MKISLLTAFSAIVIAASAATASIVVPNGDFETLSSPGAAADWTVVNPPATDVLGDGVGGSYGEVFGPGKSKISEDIYLGPNSPGKNPPVTYEVTFYAMNLDTSLSHAGATFTSSGQEFDIKLDGQPDQMVTVAAGATISSYTEYSVYFTTKNLGFRTLAFTWTGTADTGSKKDGFVTEGEGLLDNVTVTAVPEPTTLISGALLLLPFGASTLRIIRRGRAG